MKRIMLMVAALIIGGVSYAAPVSANVNDFYFSKFEADYYLGADSDGRSTLKTVEKLTAEFSDRDQNHGIERAIPKEYDGHSTSLRIESVTNEQEKALPYSTDSDNGNMVLRIGEADTYVRGTQTYVVTYTQRDVTKYFASTGRDEFYWDTNGTQWRQAFGSVVARVHLAESIVPTVTNNLACYQGNEGSTQSCEISQDGMTITARAANLTAGQNMTVAVGFTAGTWRGYEQSLWEKLVDIWIIVTIITSVIGLILLFVIPYRYTKVSNRSKELGTIVPEYIPPKDASVLLSAEIGDGTRAAMTAQIIDLSVRHYLKLYQTAEKAVLKSAEYELEIVKSIDDLSEEERTFVTTLFGKNGLSVGSRLAMKTLKSDYSMASKMQKNTKALQDLIKTKYAIRYKNAAASKRFNRAGWLLFWVGIILLAPMLLIAALVTLFCGHLLHPLTDKGLALRRYLSGLKLYIGVAEQERLKMLQSPEGAEKVGGHATDDPKKLVKLYERVLPYAVLFGQEKDWSKQLGRYYERAGTSPDWYSGHSAFNAAIFASAMNDFSSSTNSYAAASSSSSGGSGGGGSSGGGGGGGGGGGW